MKSLLERTTPRQRARIYFTLARSWGWLREKLRLKYKPDLATGGGISWLWMVEDRIFSDCFKAHDRAYESIQPGESTAEADSELHACMTAQVERFEAGLIDEQGFETWGGVAMRLGLDPETVEKQMLALAESGRISWGQYSKPLRGDL